MGRVAGLRDANCCCRHERRQRESHEDFNREEISHRSEVKIREHLNASKGDPGRVNKYRYKGCGRRSVQVVGPLEIIIWSDGETCLLARSSE